MTTLQAAAQNQLRQFVEQIERLEEEKKALAADIRDKYLEAKGVGFDVKALRKIVSMRKRASKSAKKKKASSKSTSTRWACSPKHPRPAASAWKRRSRGRGDARTKKAPPGRRALFYFQQRPCTDRDIFSKQDSACGQER